MSNKNKIRTRIEEEYIIIKSIVNQLTLVDPNIENIPVISGKDNYTIAKKIIVINVKDDDDNYLDNNELIYKLIYLYVFTFCDEHVHPKKWNNIFENLLQKAIELKLYKLPNK